MPHLRSTTPLAALLIFVALVIAAVLFVARGAAFAQQILPMPVATPIAIKAPVANPPSVTPSYPSPPPLPQSIILHGVPVLSIPNFSSSSPANSRSAKKALLEATMPAQNRGEQATPSGSPLDVAADLDRTYAARNAETLAHRQHDGPGLRVRLRSAR